MNTASPVELLITNSLGQRIETDRGALVIQELDSNIFAASLPHEDGTFGWTLTLPVDEYTVRLLGTAEGPYELTLITYDHDGNEFEEVIRGTASPGLQEDFAVNPPVPPPPPTPEPPPPAPAPPPQAGPSPPGAPPAAQGSGGGGAAPVWLLWLLGALSLLRRQRRSHVRVQGPVGCARSL